MIDIALEEYKRRVKARLDEFRANLTPEDIATGKAIMVYKRNLGMEPYDRLTDDEFQAALDGTLKSGAVWKLWHERGNS